MAAMEKSLLWGDEIPIGKFFERTDVPTLHESEPVLATEPLVKQSSRIPARCRASICRRVDVASHAAREMRLTSRARAREQGPVLPAPTILRPRQDWHERTMTVHRSVALYLLIAKSAFVISSVNFFLTLLICTRSWVINYQSSRSTPSKKKLRRFVRPEVHSGLSKQKDPAKKSGCHGKVLFFWR